MLSPFHLNDKPENRRFWVTLLMALLLEMDGCCYLPIIMCELNSTSVQACSHGVKSAKRSTFSSHEVGQKCRRVEGVRFKNSFFGGSKGPLLRGSAPSQTRSWLRACFCGILLACLDGAICNTQTTNQQNTQNSVYMVQWKQHQI